MTPSPDTAFEAALPEPCYYVEWNELGFGVVVDTPSKVSVPIWGARGMRAIWTARGEADVWQPISTVPKNKLVLLACEFDHPGDWRIKIGEYRTRGEVGWHIFGASWEPTRWMPLPAPPK